TITTDDLPENMLMTGPAPIPLSPAPPANPLSLRGVEHRHVQHVLQQMKGNKVHAAKALGVSRRALYRLIAKYHLEERGDVSSDGAPRNGRREAAIFRGQENARRRIGDARPGPNVNYLLLASAKNS